MWNRDSIGVTRSFLRLMVTIGLLADKPGGLLALSMRRRYGLGVYQIPQKRELTTALCKIALFDELDCTGYPIFATNYLPQRVCFLRHRIIINR